MAGLSERRIDSLNDDDGNESDSSGLESIYNIGGLGWLWSARSATRERKEDAKIYFGCI